jgi:hypothetical protein
MVGYKNPPKHTRWKKGQSGNPRGPKKRPKSTQELARLAIYRTVTIIRDGKRERVTRLEAFLERLIEDAITGQPTARRLLLDYLRSDPGLVRPQRVLRMIDETMTAQEAADAYAETLRAHSGGLGLIDEGDANWGRCDGDPE